MEVKGTLQLPDLPECDLSATSLPQKVLLNSMDIPFNHEHQHKFPSFTKIYGINKSPRKFRDLLL